MTEGILIREGTGEVVVEMKCRTGPARTEEV